MSEQSKLRRQHFESRPKIQSQLFSKFVADSMSPSSYDEKGDRKPYTPSMNLLRTISERTAAVTHDLESMRQILPDIELAAQILVASILSPKDMGTPELNYSVGDSFEYPELGGRLIEIVQEFFSDQYELDSELSDILYDVLFNKGSYIRLLIPESSLDEIINDQGRITFESIRPHLDEDQKSLRPLGILGSEEQMPSTLSSEGFDSTPASIESARRQSRQRQSAHTQRSSKYFHIIDNPDIVKFPLIQEHIRSERVNQRIRGRYASFEDRAESSFYRAKEKEYQNPEQFSRTLDEGEYTQKRKDEDKEQESHIQASGLSHKQIERKIESTRARKEREHLVEVKTKDDVKRKSKGHPLVIQIPTEATIPVHAPSSPKEHIGYFILLDQHGNPIDSTQIHDHYQQLQRSFRESSHGSGQGENDVSKVIKDLQGDNLDGGHGQDSSIKNITQATEVFGSIIERKLLNRLQNGEGFEDAEIERQEHVYQIMLARALKKKSTQMLFVPKELISYIAFYFTNHGIGKSLLEETRVLASVRIVLMFANTMAAIKNSTNRTELNIELDPQDTDPLSTVEMVKDAFMRTRAENYPIGEGDPSTVVRYLQQAGVDVVYSGHDALPDMKVEANEHSSNKVAVDRDLEENLRHQHIMAMGLSPETVDISRGVDFATSIVNSSLLLNKRVALYQQKLEEQQSDFIRKYIRNSQTLIDRLTEQIVEDTHTQDPDEQRQILNDFIDSLKISLPRPDTVTLESQMEAYENYERFLEETLRTYIDDEMAFEDVQGEVADYLRQLQSAVKNYYLRRWLRSNNVLTELDEMLDVDEQGNNTFQFAEMQDMHMKPIYGFVESYLKRIQESAYHRRERMKKTEEDLEKRYEVEGTDATGGGGEDTGEEGEGGDDFGLGEMDQAGGEEGDEDTGEQTGEEEGEGEGEEDTGDEESGLFDDFDLPEL